MKRFRNTPLVRLLERYTKTDITYLASGGFWLSLDQVATGLAAFLLAIAFAHFVPKETYGTYRYLLSAFWVLTAFSLTGLPTALSQAVARGREGVYRSSFATSLAWGLPFGVIALGISAYYFVNANAQFGYGFLIIAVLGPLMQPAYLFGSYLIGKKEFRVVAISGAIFAVAPAAALFATMFATQSPLVFLVIYLLSSVVTGFALAAFTYIRYRPNRVNDPEFRALGAHFSVMNLLTTLAGQVDKLVVFHYLGAVELAVYAFATALPEQLKNVFGGVSTLALPKFVARPFEEVRANFWNRLWLLTAGLALAALAYAAAAPMLFHIFFPTYAEAIFYSQVYALALVPIGSALPSTLLKAHEAKRELYILNIVSPVFQILALVLLTSMYGLIGAIAARIAGRVWTFAVSGALLEAYAWRRKRFSGA